PGTVPCGPSRSGIESPGVASHDASPTTERDAMSHDQDAAPAPAATRDRPKPVGWCELTPRAMVCGLFIAVLMGSSYPYVVLKLGFGPNVSVVAAILGYVVLGLLLTGVARLLRIRYAPYNRWENNIVQTAGTAAAQTAFMCILLAAFDMLAAKE